jgi:hypothetical protein
VGSQTLFATKHYTIAFGPIDIVVSPHKQRPGRSVTVWVHTSPFTAVQIQFRFKGRLFRILPARSGGDGWVQIRYVVPPHNAKGKVTVSAFAKVAGKSESTATTFSIT